MPPATRATPGCWTRRRIVSGLAGLPVLAAGAGCGRRPDLSPGEGGRVARVADGDLLYLDTGLAVRLVEIEAPRAGRSPDPYGESARDLLARVATGRSAQLYYGGLSRDPYDRALAHVLVRDEIGREVWLNGLMVRQGAARVRTFPDNAIRARSKQALEVEARDRLAGLWALPDYRVLGCREVLGPSRFLLVEGAVLAVAETAGDSLVRIRPEGFDLQLAPRFRSLDAALALTSGDRLRIRGRVDLRPAAGMVLTLTHWEQVERMVPAP